MKDDTEKGFLPSLCDIASNKCFCLRNITDSIGLQERFMTWW